MPTHMLLNFTFKLGNKNKNSIKKKLPISMDIKFHQSNFFIQFIFKP